MRVIKFRAWDKEHKKIVDDVIHHSLYKSLNDCLASLEVMQFTGLLDCNGKEIYEGDLYKTLGSRSIRQVFYHNGAFCGGMSLEESTPLNWGYYIQGDNLKVDDFISCIEVIGNIYEATNTTGSEIL